MLPVMPTPIAPAKINLFLHVGSARADGYHPIESLVAFADYGDDLRFTPGGNGYSISVGGPFAKDAGDPAHNLVIKAAAALKQKIPNARGGEFLLTKNLPAGAGLGGGSSDAAAALRLIAAESAIAPGDPALHAAARETGADILVCLEKKARIISGVGDVLSEPVVIPPLHAVLIWPNAPASTPTVYRAYDEEEVPRSTAFGIRASDVPREPRAFLEFLARQNNDLTHAAWRVVPHIAEADATLRAVDHVRLIRMSGSGSTVFGICESRQDAETAAAAVRAKYPEWWVQATTLT